MKHTSFKNVVTDYLFFKPSGFLFGCLPLKTQYNITTKLLDLITRHPELTLSEETEANIESILLWRLRYELEYMKF